jgi:hypothetical protein
MGDEPRRQQPQPVLQGLMFSARTSLWPISCVTSIGQRPVGRQPVRVADGELARPRIGLIQSIRW